MLHVIEKWLEWGSKHCNSKIAFVHLPEIDARCFWPGVAHAVVSIIPNYSGQHKTLSIFWHSVIAAYERPFDGCRGSSDLQYAYSVAVRLVSRVIYTNFAKKSRYTLVWREWFVLQFQFIGPFQSSTLYNKSSSNNHQSIL